MIKKAATRPGTRVIDKFRMSTRALGRLLDVDHTAISRWQKGERPIPTRWHQPLLDLSRKMKCGVKPADFFD